jgi:hypothetical protein
MDDILTGQLAGLDEDALLGIIDSASAQSEYLSRFPGDREAKAMSAVCSVITTAAEAALLFRRTNVRL